MTLTERLQSQIREVPDFPIPGILFKDISPIFLHPELVRDTVTGLSEPWRGRQVNKVLGIDSRGFILGPQIALQLDAGFVMIRKKGKLPPKTVSIQYQLEYGSAALESVVSSIVPGDRVIIHDDLLATGGTAAAAAGLAKKLGAEVIGFSFIVNLAFLQGREKLLPYTEDIHFLVNYGE